MVKIDDFSIIFTNQEMIIRNCGELLPGEDWNICDIDKSGENLPPFPEDWDEKARDHTVFSFSFKK